MCIPDYSVGDRKYYYEVVSLTSFPTLFKSSKINLRLSLERGLFLARKTGNDQRFWLRSYSLTKTRGRYSVDQSEQGQHPEKV